jgi:hypothetical protein
MKNTSTLRLGFAFKAIILFLVFYSKKANAQVYLFDNFNGNSISNTWTVTDGGSGACKWYVHAPGLIGNTSINMRGSNYLFVNSDSAGVNTVANEVITSSDLPVAQGSVVFLEFFQYYRDRATNTDSAIIEVFNGTNWVKIQNRYAVSVGTGNQPEFSKINISSHANPALKVRFRYRGNRGYYWAIDDVKIYTPPANDVGVAAINGVGRCGLTDLFSVTVRIKNFGTQAQNNIPVSYKVNNNPTINQVFTSNLPAGDSTLFTFTTPFQAVGSGQFLFSAWTSLIGDAFVQNDSTKNVATFKAAPSPSFNDFTGFTGSNLKDVFPGWTEKGGTISTDTTSLWTNSNDVQTTYFGTTTARLNLYTDNRQEWIISPAFAPVTNSVLRFKMALTTWNNTASTTLGGDDSLIVKVSTDCGASWEDLQAYTAEDNISNTLAVFSVPLSQYVGQTIQIAFYGTDGSSDDTPDNDIHIDDIEVLIPSAIDARLTSLVLPPTNCGVGSSLFLKVQITNNGTSPITSIPVSCKIEGQAPINQTFNQTLAPNATVLLTFTTPLILATPGDYFISAWVSVSGDGNVLNDSIKNRKVTRFGGQLNAVNFSNFTGTNLTTLFPGWLESTGNAPTGTFSDWTNSNATQTTNLGSTTARINIFSSFSRDWIVSPNFEPSSNSTLKFKIAITSAAGTNPSTMGLDDSVIVRVSTNCGLTWTNLKSFTRLNSLTNQLREFQVFLGQFSGQSISVAFFATDGTVDNIENYDFHIDDISLGEASANDIGLESLDIPNTNCGIASTLSLKVKIGNFGTAPQNSVTLKYSINNQTPVEETFNQSLASGEVTVLTFTNPIIFTNPGNYSLSVWSAIPGDQNQVNDSIKNLQFERSPSFLSNVNFNTFNGSNLSTILPGWSEQNGANPSGTTSSWTNGSILQTTALGSGTTIQLNIFSSFTNDWIMLPSLAPVAGSILKFKAAVMQFGTTNSSAMGSDDSVKVMVSTNCGQTWVRVRSFSENSAPTNQLTEYTVSLAAYSGQNIRIGFWGKSGNTDNTQDYNFHLDDMQVVVPVPNDVGVSGIILPSSECGLPVSLNLSVTLSNYGTQAQTSFPVSYRVNDLPIVTQNFSGNLSAGTSTSFAFSQPVDLSISDVVKLKVWTNLPVDQLVLNDTLTNNLNLPPSIMVQNDFNNYNGDNISDIQTGWKESSGYPPSGTTSNWLASTTSQTTTLGSTTARMGYFGNSRKEWLIGPVLTPVAESKLNILLAVTNRSSTASDLMGSDDSLNIMATTNCGQSWTLVKAFTRTDQLGNQLSNQIIPLASFAGQRIQVGIYATEGIIDNVEDYDVHVDNIFVSLNTSTSDGQISEKQPLFPNPANNSFSILLGQGRIEPSKIDMFTLDGRSVVSNVNIVQEDNKYNVNVSRLTDGLYFVSFISNGKREMKPVVVKH